MNRFDYRLVRQLSLLAAVVDAGSVTKAAENLAISVPPIVAQLNELETRFEPLLSKISSGKITRASQPLTARR